MLCHTRTNWEFYAVVDGRCGFRLQDEQMASFAEHALWIFPPDCSHAWADDGRPFSRIAMHFSTVPHPLEAIVRERGFFQRSLSASDVSRIREIANELEPHYQSPNLLSPLIFEGRLMDLAVLALSDHVTLQIPVSNDSAVSKVEHAIAWFTENLGRKPSVREVADAVHVSRSHLRRLFREVRKASPKQVFQSIRLEKANELMSHSAYTLDEVARRCGFANASHLCREYRSLHNFSPTRWRKRLVASFAQPVPSDYAPVREFSARPADRMVSL